MVYCVLNEIDVREYINSLLKKAFMEDKYGTMPFDKKEPVVMNEVQNEENNKEELEIKQEPIKENEVKREEQEKVEPEVKLEIKQKVKKKRKLT